MSEEGSRASGGPDLSAARREAERLVATGLAALSMAADRIGAPSRPRGGAAAAGYDALGDMLFGPSRRHSVANDSAECCHCPVCRVIAVARQPSPEFAERLASGVGTLAEGAARVLRVVAGPGAESTGPESTGPAPTADSSSAGKAEPRKTESGPVHSDRAGVDDPWAAATAESGSAAE
jgi:hypothetical protein